jgi:hypothetical protein
MLIEDSFLRKLAFKLLLSMLLLMLLVGCSEPHVVISFDEKVPPSFKFTGTGTLPFFVVIDLGDEKSTEVSDAVLWKITPNSAKAGTVPLGPITYGVVPDGWTQTVPAQGSPPELVERRVYHAGGPEIEMPEGVVKFKIAGGRVLRN